MARHSFSRTLCTLPIFLTRALAHMQMEEPSPLRDPHSNRTNEPKDYNILTPLHSDGSDFTCKGYQWNTPLTSVATYEAGQTYEMKLRGGATHGGGSCQISLSCDNGMHFKTLKSIMGGCPLEDTYDFTIPDDVQTAQCLLAWTWFNKVGNREMYMNCAVVDIVGAGGSKKRATDSSDDLNSSADSSALAQAALEALPDIYVANLAGINDCVTKETSDPIFDDPGTDVVYGDGLSASSAGSSSQERCTGVGRKSAGDGSLASLSSSSSLSGSSGSSGSSGNSGGNDGQWHSDDSNKSTGSGAQSGECSQANDGQWHPDCYGKADSSQSSTNSEQSTNNDLGSSSSKGTSSNKGPSSIGSSTGVEKELDEYLNDLDSADSSQEENQVVEDAGADPDAKPFPSSQSQMSSSSNSMDDSMDDSASTNDRQEMLATRPSKSDRKKSKPGEFYDLGEDDTYNYGYGGGDSYYGDDYSFRRQRSTRQILDADGPTSVVGPDAEYILGDEDPDLVPGIEIISDETTRFMAVKDGSTTINAPIPTKNPIFDSDGNILVDSPLVAFDSDSFLVPEPAPVIPSRASFNSSLPAKTSLPIETGFRKHDAPLEASLPDASDDANVDLLSNAEELPQSGVSSVTSNLPGLSPLEAVTDEDFFFPDSRAKKAKNTHNEHSYLKLKPTTRPVRPEAEGFAHHTPLPRISSSTSDSGIPIDADEYECPEVGWKCQGCTSPNRCVKIDKCQRVCTRLPYTGFAVSTSAPVINFTATTLLRAPQAAAHIDQPYLPFLSWSPSPATPTIVPTATGVAPIEQSILEGPVSAEAGRCRESTPSYATSNLEDYLPCRPGTFLCKSPTQFYVCGNFGGSNWTYGALRSVTDGMTCEPRLSEGSIGLSKREWDPEEDSDDDWFSHEGGDDSSSDAELKVEDLIAQLKSLDASIEKLVEAAGNSSGDVSEDLSRRNGDARLDEFFAKMKRTLMSKFWKRRWDEKEFSDGSNGGDGIDDDPQEFFSEPEVSLSDGYDSGDSVAGPSVDTSAGAKDVLSRWRRALRKRQEQDIDIPPGFEFSDGSDGGDGVDGNKEAADKMFGKPQDLLYQGLENPDPESSSYTYGDDNGEDSSASATDDSSSYSTLADEDVAELSTTGVSASIPEQTTTFADYSSNPDAAPEELDRSEKRKRQSLSDFTFSDGSDGGDGVDSDPVALFGNEPVDYDQIWPVSSIQEDITPYTSIDVAAAATAIPMPTLVEKPSTLVTVAMPSQVLERKKRQEMHALGGPPQAGPGAKGGAQAGPGPAPAAKPGPAPPVKPASAPGVKPAAVGPGAGSGPAPGAALPAGPQVRPQVAPGAGPGTAPGPAPGPGLAAGSQAGPGLGPAPTVEDDGGDGIDDDPEKLFPGLAAPDPLTDGLVNPNAEGAELDSAYDLPVETDTYASDYVPIETDIYSGDDAPTETDIYSDGDAPIETSISGIGADAVATTFGGLLTTTESNIVTPTSGPAPTSTILDTTTTNTNATLGDVIKQLVQEKAETEPVLGESRKGEQEDGDWEDGVLPGFFVPSSESGTAPSSAAATEVNVAASILPFFLAPGPVIPSGMSVSWPVPTGVGEDPEVPTTFATEASARPGVEAQASPTIAPGVKEALEALKGSPTVAPGVEKAVKATDTPAEAFKRRLKKLKRAAKKEVMKEKRQGCPTVPTGYYRNDQYVSKA